MDELDHDKIDRLEKKLYSRKRSSWQDIRTDVPQTEHEVERTWKEDAEIKELLKKERDRREVASNALFKKIFIGSVAFFVLAAGVAFVMFFKGNVFVSATNIDIQVVGPSIVAGGDELSLDVVMKNGNRADLIGATLLVEYPEGTRVAENLNEPLVRQREVIGQIQAGREVRKTIKSVMFGEKETIKEIKMTLEYRIQGSSATFFKDKNHEVVIKSSPVIVEISGPDEINSNQEMRFAVSITSNSGILLEDLMLIVEYPFGYSFQSSNPKPSLDDNIWKVGDLPPTGKREIGINGILQGQNDEERTFRFLIGVASDKNEDEIGPIFSVLTESVTIRRPFIGVDVAISGSKSDSIVVRQGESVSGSIVLTNNLPAAILNAKIEAKFTGQALDRSKVAPGSGGFFRSTDNTIIWDKVGTPDLSRLEPGESEVVNFSFSTLQSLLNFSGNQEIRINFAVSGSQIGDLGKPESVTTTVGRNVKIASNTGISARSVRSVGPFENMGPIPPKAETQTTYTVLWNLTNSLNTISQTKVKTKLPSYVKWVGLSSPSIESLSFDENNREVIWNVGDLHAGAGFSSAAREAAFQIIIEPSLTQVGSTPVIILESVLTGEDRFTGQTVTASSPALTTRFNTDPNYKSGDEVVTK